MFLVAIYDLFRMGELAIYYQQFNIANCRGQRLLLPSMNKTLVADLLTFYLQRMSLPLFALLQLYISIVIPG